MTTGRYGRLAGAVLAATLMLPVVAAQAGEGNGPSYPGYIVPNVALGTVTVGDAAQAHGAQPAQEGIALGDTLPSNSNSKGEPEPVNSLPRGFDNGEPGLAYQQSVQHYWAGRQQ